MFRTPLVVVLLLALPFACAFGVARTKNFHRSSSTKVYYRTMVEVASASPSFASTVQDQLALTPMIFPKVSNTPKRDVPKKVDEVLDAVGSMSRQELLAILAVLRATGLRKNYAVNCIPLSSVA